MRLATVLFAAAVLVTGCKKKETAPSSEPAGSATPMTKPVPPPPAATTPPPAAAAATPGPVVGWEKMSDIQLPAKVPGAPDKGMWSSARATKDGDRLDNFVDGNDYWVVMRMLDCNLPMVQEAASKTADERGLLDFCFAAPTGKVKDFPLIAKDDSARAVKAGHVVLIASLGAAGVGKVKPADLEALLDSMDLAGISKL